MLTVLVLLVAPGLLSVAWSSEIEFGSFNLVVSALPGSCLKAASSPPETMIDVTNEALPGGTSTYKNFLAKRIGEFHKIFNENVPSAGSLFAEASVAAVFVT
jgi:hypothetical protein